MDIQIINKYDNLFKELDLNIIKSFSGLYDIEKIKKELSDLYYENVFIDITSIKDYYNINTVIYFLKVFPKEKVHILLDNSQVAGSNEYINELINNGYFNITKNHLSLMFLRNNPGTREDAIKLLEKEVMEDAREEVLEVKTKQNIMKRNVKKQAHKKVQVIAVQNLTKNAGATSLVYMMYNHLSKRYNVKVAEMFKTDLRIYSNSDFFTFTDENQLERFINENNNLDVILVDFNNVNKFTLIDTLIYLVEPTKLKVNQLILKDKHYNSKIKNHLVVVNKSLISQSDLRNLEYEMKIKSFYMLPNIGEDETDNVEINKMLYKMGFSKQRNKRRFFN